MQINLCVIKLNRNRIEGREKKNKIQVCTMSVVEIIIILARIMIGILGSKEIEIKIIHIELKII